MTAISIARILVCGEAAESVFSVVLFSSLLVYVALFFLGGGFEHFLFLVIQKPTLLRVLPSNSGSVTYYVVGFGVTGLLTEGSSPRIRVQGCGSPVFRTWGLGFRTWGLGFRV